MTGGEFRREARTVLVVGAGAIGTGWAAHFLLHGRRVVLTDPAPAAREAARPTVLGLVGEVAAEAPTGSAEAGHATDAGDRLAVLADPLDAAADADVVVECGPERAALKQELVAALDRALPADVLLTSSSSGLRPSLIQERCRRPERVLVAHPFNPPHLMPLVELVGGARTAPAAVDAAEAILTAVGKRVIRVNGELPGHVVNRLQAALWREAYHLVTERVVSVADLDTAVAWGPGLRWALLGPFATQHLSGGGRGIAHVLEHLGPPMEEWWRDLGDAALTPETVDIVVSGVAEEVGTEDEADLRARRDAALRRLLRMKAETGLD